MRLLQFEQPAPKLECSIKKVNLEGFGFIEGSFMIKNVGEGQLSGSIFSQLDNLELSPESFDGNNIKVAYMVNLYDYKSDDKISTSAVIRSNGGEAIIPFEFNIVPASIITKEGQNIYSLNQFLDYSIKNPLSARTLLSQKDFMLWLFSIGYSYMDIYDKFVSDPNKERALDNFLIFNKLKQKATILPTQTNLKVQLPQDSSAYTAGIGLKRTTFGYATASLAVRKGSWLKLSKNKVESRDFDENNFTEVDYIILTDELKARDTAIVDVESENIIQRIYLTISFKKAFNAYLNKNSYAYEDKGVLSILNNTGKDLMLDINTKDNFIKFDANRYYIGKSAQINFDIKFSALATSLGFKKKLFINSQIFLSSNINGIVTTKKLDIRLSAI